MSLREFYAALYAKAPPEEKENQIFESDEPFFDQEELEVLAEMRSRTH